MLQDPPRDSVRLWTLITVPLLLLFIFSLYPHQAEAGFVYGSKFGSTGSGDGEFQYPAGIAIDASDNVYVSDYTNNTITQFDSDGNFVQTIDVSGSADYPYGLALDGDGNFYLNSSSDYLLHKFSPDGVEIAAWGPDGIGGSESFGGAEGSPVVDNDRVYVIDYYDALVYVFDLSGNLLNSFGGDVLSEPGYSAVDANHNLWVPDYNNSAVYEFSPTGALLHSFGESGTGEGEFSGVWALTLDSSGRIFANEYDDTKTRIQVFNPDGTYLYAFGAYGTGDGQFDFEDSPMAFDSMGNLYIVDTDNNRVQKFDYVPTSVSRTIIPIDEGETTTYSVVLESQPSSTVTIDFSTTTPSVGAGASVSPSSITFTPENWNTPHTITVSAEEDPAITGARSITISGLVSSEDLAFDATGVPETTVNISDTVSIASCADLQSMADHLEAHYSLSQNIDCTSYDPNNDGKGFVPIGTEGDPFTGNLNGNGHTITGLTISRPEETGVGLFGVIYGGTIQNLTLSGGSVEGKEVVGALVGDLTGNANIQTVTSSVEVVGHGATVGGLVGGGGDSETKSLTDCQVSGSVSVTSNADMTAVGGLAGNIGGATITRCSALGDVTVTATGSVTAVGGLIGSGWYGEIVNQSYSTNHVSVTANDVEYGVGGLIGFTYYGPSIRSSYSTSTIDIVTTTSAEGGIGGLIGNAEGYFIEKSYAKAVINIHAGTSANSIGGLVGALYRPTEPITDSFDQSTISVTADSGDISNVGGILGVGDPVNSSVERSYASTTLFLNATGAIQRVGGLVGNTHNIDHVTGSLGLSSFELSSGSDTLTDVGGLLGDNQSVTLTNNYFAKGVTEQNLCTGQDDPDPSGCTGVDDASSFLGTSAVAPLSSWNFTSIWQIVAGKYPTLRGLSSPYATESASSPTPTPRAGSKRTIPAKVSRTAPYEVYTTGVLDSAPEKEGQLPNLSPVEGYAFSRYLTLGVKDDQVRALQQKLNLLGFTLAPSGLGSLGNETDYFGRLTEAAVKKFQIAHNITPTGTVGPITRTALNGL